MCLNYVEVSSTSRWLKPSARDDAIEGMIANLTLDDCSSTRVAFGSSATRKLLGFGHSDPVVAFWDTSFNKSVHLVLRASDRAFRPARCGKSTALRLNYCNSLSNSSRDSACAGRNLSLRAYSWRL